jgi:uracil-DNA glycosylase
VERRFLFGQPVLPARPAADGPRRLFVLGAYPSALHVRWFGPDGSCLIQAVAVDNEPEPFWTGSDEAERIERWLESVAFRAEWGCVRPCGGLNGPSGDWVQANVLDALGVARDEAWITDCLDTYFESQAAARRLESDRVASVVRELSIPPRRHATHPSESQIVRFALQGHRDRLRAELDLARPECVVTLGNAALRVFGELVEVGGGAMKKLSVDGFGSPVTARLDGRAVRWLPLAHPAAPAIYQAAHRQWVDAGPVCF